MNEFKFSKIKYVKSPSKGTIVSAGWDFYVPELTDSFLRDFLNKNDNAIDLDNKVIRLSPSERVLIPSGIKVSLPENTALIAFNKSGVSSKLGLDVLANVVDEDYQGELHLSVVNTSNNYVDINCGMKLVQFILLNINHQELIEIKNEKDLYNGKTTERLDGGFGSTGI